MAPLLKKMAFVLLFCGIVLVGLEWYARTIDASAARKQRDFFALHQDSLAGIMVGPSYSKRAINPLALDYLTASFANAGSSVEMDVVVAERALSLSEPEFILFDLSVGRLDSPTPLDVEKKRLYYYYGVTTQRLTLKDFFLLRHPFYRFFTESKAPPALNEAGFQYEVKKDADNDRTNLLYEPENFAQNKQAQELLSSHNQQDPDTRKKQVAMLHHLIETCRSKGIKVVFHSPPKFYLYNEHLADWHREHRLAFLEDVVDDSTVYFWDLEDFHAHKPDLFLNINHVSPLGAVDYTREINRRLATILID